jgi:hypothetical protein
MNRIISIVVALAVPLAGCGQGAAPRNDQAAANNAAQPTAATPSDRLLAAAEPFEKLTETAFTETLPALDTTIGEARMAGDGVRDILAAADISNMDGLLGHLGRHRRSESRADIALTSIEIYRILVSAVPVGAKIPSAVSLLDYAGFRYQADLKASPVRWDDMTEATRFARTQWAIVAPQLSAAPLSATFEASLVDMEKALAARDATSAAKAVTTELDLVDQLEGYFSKR